jgi:hypothetical protein
MVGTYDFSINTTICSLPLSLAFTCLTHRPSYGPMKCSAIGAVQQLLTPSLQKKLFERELTFQDHPVWASILCRGKLIWTQASV